MNNHTKKQPATQPKAKHEQRIKELQNQWDKDAKKLACEKANIGYEEFSWEAFMEIDPDTFSDTVKQSQVIALQERHKDLTEQRNLLWAEDNIIKELNDKHAIVHTEQTYILTEKKNTLGCQDFSLESRQSFKMFYEDETIMCIDGTERCVADIWLKSPKRRKFKGIIFDPETPGNASGYYNLWKGFAKKPIQGNCSRYWQHVKDNICNGDEEAYQYLRKWLAYIFQHPHVVHTALVLCGTQGVGKDSFVQPLGNLFGSHFAPLSNINELVSNFNYHLKNAVLIHANEALWGGHKKDIGTIKSMITDPVFYIEGKGKDRIPVRNFRHVIVCSNEDWPVHMDPDDRRFFVLNVSEAHKNDTAYFGLLRQELENGGYEALLYDLLHEDISNFDPRQLPANSNSFAIKMRSADSAHRYLHMALNEGGFSIAKMTEDIQPVWQLEVPKDSIYEDYAGWGEKSGEEVLSKALFGRVMKKLIRSVEDKRPGGVSRLRCYKFLSLRQTQEDFAKAFKEEPERIFDTYDDDVQALVQDDLL